MIQNLPDLSLPLPGVPGAAYRAFGRDGLVIAVPDRLTLEAELDGTPRLLVTLIRGGGTSTTTGGRFELGLSIESDLEGIGGAIAAEGTPASLAVADFAHAVLTITARLGPVAPTQLAPPMLLPPDLLTRARTVVELSADAAGIASKIIEDETLPVDATMRVAFRAVAHRMPFAITFNPRAVAERIAAQAGASAVTTVENFERVMDALLAGPEIVSEGDPQAADPAVRARTVALRMRDRFAVRAESDAGALKLIAPAEVPSGQERIDFAEPAMVLVEQSISLDPVSAARSMRNGRMDDLVRRIEVPPVPTGRQRIAVSANLPEPVAGLLTLIADVRAPALPPFRPQPVSTSALLNSADRRGEVELRLSPGEPLDLEVRLRAVVARNGEPAEILGPWRATQRSAVLLGPADFGAPLLVLRASRALTALAVIEVLSEGAIVGRLDTATPMTAIPLTEAAPHIVVRPLGAGRTIEIELEGRKRLDLDLATLPGFGAHRARLATADMRSILVEWRSDGDEEEVPQAVRMGPDRRVAEIAWLAASPFRPAMMWRATRDGTPGSWSAPVLPQDGLLIDVDGRDSMKDRQKSVVIDGIELNAKDEKGRAWTYVPVHPTLETNERGAPMLQVIEAGPAAFLQCTARVALNEDARARLLASLKQKEPEAETLEAAPLAVERITLEVKVGNDWRALAESKGSGLAPWTAALAATLASDPLAAIKSAVAGEKDHARLVAQVVLQGSSASFRRAETTGDARVETPAGAASASFATTTDSSSPGSPPERRGLAVDLSDFFSQPG